MFQILSHNNKRLDILDFIVIDFMRYFPFVLLACEWQLGWDQGPKVTRRLGLWEAPSVALSFWIQARQTEIIWKTSRSENQPDTACCYCKCTSRAWICLLICVLCKACECRCQRGISAAVRMCLDACMCCNSTCCVCLCSCMLLKSIAVGSKSWLYIRGLYVHICDTHVHQHISPTWRT